MRDLLGDADGRALLSTFDLGQHRPAHPGQSGEVFKREIRLLADGADTITESANGIACPGPGLFEVAQLVPLSARMRQRPS
jgi:hypothetical protein